MSMNVKLNGILMSQLGISMLSPAYSNLMSPPPLKQWIENDAPDKHGVDVDEGYVPPVGAREVSLTFLVYGSSYEDFLSKYNYFVDVLKGGIVELTVPDLNSCYRLKYISSVQFENYRLNACKLVVKFKENNPNNRDIKE